MVGDPIAILNHAITLDIQGDRVAARALMQKVADQLPAWDEPWLRLGQSLRGEGNAEAAATAYDAALARNPQRVDALLARGIIALGRQPPQDAAALLRRATELAPEQHQAWHVLGYAYAAMGLTGAAAQAVAKAGHVAPDCYLYACDLDDLNDRLGADAIVSLPPWSDRVRLARAGRTAMRCGALGDAADALEAAVALMPDDPVILKQLAAVHLSAMQPELAEPLLREAHRLVPDDTMILNDLAVTLGRLYRFGEAEAVMATIGVDQPTSPQMLFNRATLRASIGDFDGSCRDIEAAKGNATDIRAALQSECALLPYRSGMTAEVLRGAMVTLGTTLPRGNRPVMQPRHPKPADLDRPLRVGLLSNALRQHPVGWLTFAGLKALDRAMFTLHCFGHFEPDDSFAPDFARHVQAWHNIDGLGDLAVAELISAQAIDILLDLSGFGDGGRIAVLAYRPAPVQIKWVGSQATTTGVPTIDWMITDRWETPEGYDHFYTERLLRLPDGYVCYMPPPIVAAMTDLPALANGHITFGCFNNLAKLTDDTLRLWGRLLARLPDARLKLRCPQFSEGVVHDRFRVRTEAMGIDCRRVELQGRAPHPVFIAGYSEIDIALDPYPYSGGLTTCEALFMGVPVITLAGDFFAARHSVSHLSNVGVEACIATTTSDYIEKAVTMAKDLTALAALRANLRQRVLKSPLCDAERFGQNLGTALRFAWHDYCAAHLDAPKRYKA
ncbi:MAG: tetratricopeptide repeat protein [Acidiphilium sp.]|nr:tetratricopeptide repeat protein [Acidiphilium sp.]MDD4936438.1 tetratricopeptide repeat protein [Acidiphilium sp.]